MLELKQIVKEYVSGEEKVHALRGINLSFREHEFVSILGPSGCGKTTLLNIIGGLDSYTSGDLQIDDVSTKEYKARDWDAYRNHKIGFVFQSYNLIPHQSVLSNVELALTLSGVSKSERRKRAKEALIRVGLGDQLKKKPNQMSGGQMQRVAIARALVNDPDIILADEPTGALDTETSVQVMELLKEISGDRLIIMVTHNPELAEKYSTRIVRMLDGKITDDTSPLSEEEKASFKSALQTKSQVKKKIKKPSMSLFTAFGLSLRNLVMKKGRTALTAFAGSIGIIGIALILAVSQGTTAYINNVQEDALSSYPLTIEATNIDISTLMQTFMGVASDKNEHEKDAVYSQSVMFDMINALNNVESTENDLKSFKSYIETELSNKNADEETKLDGALSGVSYTYDFDLLVFTKNVDGSIIPSDTQKLLSKAIQENMGMNMSSMMEMRENSPFSSLMSSSSYSMMGTPNLWCEMLSAKNGAPISPILEKQYDVIYGEWPKAYDEIVLVLDENNELDDLTLYALGLESEDEINEVFKAVNNGEEINTEQKKWSYEDICNTDFRVVLNSDCYVLDEDNGLYNDLRDNETGLRYLYDNALTLKVTGIIRPNESANSAMLSGSIGYTKMLSEYVIEHSHDSKSVKAQLASKDTDIFSGLPFKDNTGSLSDDEKAQEFRSYIDSLNTENKAKAYLSIKSIPSDEEIDSAVADFMSNNTRTELEETMVNALLSQMSMNENDVRDYISSMNDEDFHDICHNMIEQQIRAKMQAEVQARSAAASHEELAAALIAEIPNYTSEQCSKYYEEILEFSENSYDDNLKTLGYVDIDTPASVNLYASTFENKDVIEDVISEYNKTVDDLSQIRYTDYVGIMMSSVTTIINAITYVLIAFVAISLVVSSIMIGVITLISVQERTKEIGILRAIGASKRNVSSMFNAETVMIGFTSGLIGVLVTDILCIPINAIIQSLTGIPELKAFLPIPAAIILVAISVLLTLLSGIIPSRSAAKKDPVVALRTE